MNVLQNKDLPHEVEKLDGSLDEYTLPGKKENYFRVSQNKFILYKDILSSTNPTLRSDDTFIVTYPRSGTTVTQELIWLICNNLDYTKAKSRLLPKRFPFLEKSILVKIYSVNGQRMDGAEKQNHKIREDLTSVISEVPSPRFIKTHIPLSLLPPVLLNYAKVVYVARNPKDVMVSFYYYHKLIKGIPPDYEFKDFWKSFITDKVIYAPYFKHLLDAWEMRNHSNMLFLFYEEIIKNMPGTIRRVANFFNKSYTDEQINTLAEHLQFDNFKENKSVNNNFMLSLGFSFSDGAFIRKGKSGGWKEYFDEAMIAETEEWIAKNLRNTDLCYPH